MTKQEHEAKYREMHKEYVRLGWDTPEGQKLWSAFWAEHNRRSDFYAFKKAVADRVIAEHGFCVTAAQRRVLEDIIFSMVDRKLGLAWAASHYEYTEADPESEFCVKRYSADVDEPYIVRANTKSMEKMQSLGIVNVLRFGGRWGDVVTVNFDFELTEAMWCAGCGCGNGR